LQIAGIISRALYDTAFARRVPSCAWYFDFYARVSQRIPRAPEQPRLQLIENQMVLKMRLHVPLNVLLTH
jgi:hypothetical protein